MEKETWNLCGILSYDSKMNFFVFLKNHNMQGRILEKKFWNVGRSMFRAYPWSPKCNIEKTVARALPNWVEIKNLNVESGLLFRKFLSL